MPVRPSVVWTIESSISHYRPWTTSMDDFTVVYRQISRTTSSSSKENLVNCIPYSCLRKLSLFINDLWYCPLLVMDDPYGRTGDSTNSVSYQLLYNILIIIIIIPCWHVVDFACEYVLLDFFFLNWNLIHEKWMLCKNPI